MNEKKVRISSKPLPQQEGVGGRRREGERKTFTFIAETVEVEESVCPKTFQRLFVWGRERERERENRKRSNNKQTILWGKG